MQFVFQGVQLYLKCMCVETVPEMCASELYLEYVSIETVPEMCACVCRQTVLVSTSTNWLETHETKNQKKFQKKQKKNRCLISGATFTEIKKVPDVFKEPKAWFQVVDADMGGNLDKNEVEEALGAILPIEREKLKRAIASHWHEWDPDDDGTIFFF